MRLSFIIPVYNSEKGIRDTLYSIVNQNNIELYDVEVIVIDNNSTDKTYETADKIALNYSFISLYIERKKGSYSARNKGISVATGDILCFVDADVKIEAKFIEKLIKEKLNNNFMYAGFNVKMNLPSIKSQRTIYSDYDALTSFNNIKDSIKVGNYTPTICLAIDKSVIAKVGPFDSKLESGGDVEFGKRVRSAGFSQAYLGKIIVHHPTRNSKLSLENKAKRVGRGYAQLYNEYRDIFYYKLRAMRSLSNYLPHNPIKLYIKNKEDNRGYTFAYCLFLSFIRLKIKKNQRHEFFKNI